MSPKLRQICDACPGCDIYEGASSGNRTKMGVYMDCEQAASEKDFCPPAYKHTRTTLVNAFLRLHSLMANRTAQTTGVTV